jgi:hypothetical protein
MELKSKRAKVKRLVNYKVLAREVDGKVECIIKLKNGDKLPLNLELGIAQGVKDIWAEAILPFEILDGLAVVVGRKDLYTKKENILGLEEEVKGE